MWLVRGLDSDFYPRNSEDAYWSNYAHQYGVLIDDFPKVDSDRIQSPMFSEFLNIKSNVPYNVNMAAVNDKGKSFVSRLIGMTTNNRMWVPESMLDKKVYLCRRDVVMSVELDPACGLARQLHRCAVG